MIKYAIIDSVKERRKTMPKEAVNGCFALMMWITKPGRLLTCIIFYKFVVQDCSNLLSI